MDGYVLTENMSKCESFHCTQEERGECGEHCETCEHCTCLECEAGKKGQC